MENEDIMTLLVNQAAETHKQWRRMVQKYVFDPQKRDVTEAFMSDAREWAEWKRLGVV